MSDEQEIGGEDYREIAERVRQLARQARIAEVQQELFDLADRLERMAEANGTKPEGKQ
jgi:molecular chaperone GrpE (heat shock protein)